LDKVIWSVSRTSWEWTTQRASSRIWIVLRRTSVPVHRITPNTIQKPAFNPFLEITILNFQRDARSPEQAATLERMYKSFCALVHRDRS
jgi:hypothetical protein